MGVPVGGDQVAGRRVPVEEMPPGVSPVDFSLSPEERVERIVKLMQAGVVGEPNDHPQSSPEIQRLYFDTVERSVDHSAVDGKPVTIQWRFEDADPWYLRIDNGSSRAERGETADADLTFESSARLDRRHHPPRRPAQGHAQAQGPSHGSQPVAADAEDLPAMSHRREALRARPGAQAIEEGRPKAAPLPILARGPGSRSYSYSWWSAGDCVGSGGAWMKSTRVSSAPSVHLPVTQLTVFLLPFTFQVLLMV